MVWLGVLAFLGALTLTVALALVLWVGRWRARVHVPRPVFFALFDLPNPADGHDELVRQWQADSAEDEAVRTYTRRSWADYRDRDELAA